MHTLWLIFTGLFRWTWRLLNFIRKLVVNLFVLALILIVIGIYYSYQGSTPKALTHGALLVNLNGVVVDTPSTNNKIQQLGREVLGVSSNRTQENSLFDIVESIRQAKDDKKISGMVLQLNDFTGADQPSLQYIGKALREFRDSGKPIYAIGDRYNQTQYYLASYANNIYLTPFGSVNIQGFATNNLYYKSLLEKLDVTTNVFRVGKYKSAVEPVLRDDMSPEAREADKRWVDGLWQNYLATIAQNRHLSTQQLFPEVTTQIAQLKMAEGSSAKYALNNKLVDKLMTRSEIESELVKVFGWDKQNNNYNAISIYDYAVNPAPQQNDQVAVIFANGAIVDGVKTAGQVGGDTTAAELRQARLDPKIKAIILRVNSPGGSVTAAEVIRAELEAIHQAGKPIVVSMGGMAASGGYWISTPADYIIASPSTLTGSIGIFSIINTYEKPLDYLGVHTDGVSTSPLAGLTLTKKIPSEFAQMMQLGIENGYQNFIGLVAKSRNLTTEKVDSIAQGHVWLGSDAKNNGLVDQLGDFDDAVKKATELAHLSHWQLNWFIEPQGFTELAFSQFMASVYAMLPATFQSWLPPALLPLANALTAQPDALALFNDPQNRYALCLSCSNVQ